MLLFGLFKFRTDCGTVRQTSFLKIEKYKKQNATRLVPKVKKSSQVKVMTLTFLELKKKSKS